MILQKHFIVRAPILPACHYDRTLLDIAPDSPKYYEQLREYLVDLSCDSLLMEAIQVSSPTLARELSVVINDHNPKASRLERLAIKTSKYAIRASLRPTPFGLFAGVALGTFSETPSAQWGKMHRKHVRPDSEWFVPLMHRWQTSPDVLSESTLTTNSLCYLRGGRYILPHVRTVNPEYRQGAAQEVSIKASTPVRILLDAARTSTTYQDLCDTSVRALPKATPTAIHDLITRLLTHDFLLSDLQWHQDSRDDLEWLTYRTAAHPESSTLADIEQQIRKYAGQPLGVGASELQSAQDTITSKVPAARSALQVDLELDLNVALPESVAREGERVALALTTLARRSSYSVLPWIATYHARYLERYGTHALVPLPQLLDPNTGLGAPDGYEAPRDTTRRLDLDTALPMTRPNLALATRLQQALLDGAAEVVLDDDFIAEMGDSPEQSEIDTPAYFDLCLELSCESVEKAAEGDFTLLLSGVASTPTPGAMMGRFTRHLGATALLGDLLEAPRTIDWISAQIVYAPARPRQVNVSKVPDVLGAVIPLGVPYDGSMMTLLPAEIAVGATNERLYLWSTVHQAPVFAVLPNMVRIDSTPNIVRLLAEVSQSWVTTPRRWSWGQFEALPYLPRVRYGRTVICKARWRPDDTLRDHSLSWSGWLAALRTWRGRWRVPDLVELVMADNRLELDLRSSFHCRLLRTELESHGEVLLTEAMDLKSRTWLDGHTAEFVVSAKEEPSAPTATLTAKPILRERPTRHAVGKEWLYFKLYSRAESQDELLRGQLPELLHRLAPQVDRWFFIRYVDPRHHLRLRLHGDPNELRDRVLPVIGDAMEGLRRNGEIVDWTVDHYEPEMHRYGGPDTLEMAERVFCADSALVLGQLCAHTHAALGVEPETLTALNGIRFLTDLGIDWAPWALTVLAPHLSGSPLRPELRGQVRVLDPRDDWYRLKVDGAGAELHATWQDRAKAAGLFSNVAASLAPPYPTTPMIARSLLHMHANRLLGVDLEAERQAYLMLVAAARMLLNREDRP
ncbi:lantibiotic dehydratase [Nonomuraea sp. CA-143628]|uniref:lantibiotic dehydratase n=1 Tax=Nonomuraea sp. CA-143628 TaxID=3239997 RepID=UPI003D8A6914